MSANKFVVVAFPMFTFVIVALATSVVEAKMSRTPRSSPTYKSLLPPMTTSYPAILLGFTDIIVKPFTTKLTEVAFLVPIFKELFPSLKMLLLTKFSVNKLVVVAEVIVARSEVRLLKAADKALNKLVTILFAEIFVAVALVIVALVRLTFVATKFVKNKSVNEGESEKLTVTLPKVSVATVRLEEAEINLYKFEIEVVATIPFIFVVTIEPFSSKEILLELMIEVEVASPFTIEVRVFSAEFKEF
jgi:hypothetical protein